MAAFEAQLTIRFADADPAGVVFYPRAIALAHGVIEDLVRQSEIGWHGWFDNPGLAVPVRRVEADFLAPIHAGETLGVRAWVEKLGETAAHFAVEFIGSGGEIRARIRTVHVIVDLKSKKPVPMTPEQRKALQTFSA